MRKTQKFAIVGGTVAVLLAGGVAYAAWTSTGSGSGSVAAGTQHDLVVTGTDVTGLYPTGNNTFDVTIDNADNPYTVAVDQIALNGTVTVTGGLSIAGEAACGAGDVTAEIVDAATGLEIAGSGSQTVLGAVKLTMHGDASGDCQSATFHVPVKATAHAIN
jgi:hypothetical protein